MTTRKIEVQGTTEIEWTSTIEVDIPEKVLQKDDPDAISEWVDLNVPTDEIRKAQVNLTVTHNQTGADLIKD